VVYDGKSGSDGSSIKANAWATTTVTSLGTSNNSCPDVPGWSCKSVCPTSVNMEGGLAGEPKQRCRAQAAGDGRQIGSGRVSLVTPARYVPPPGDELTIDYGAKSNEQLLFLYGARQCLSQQSWGGSCMCVPRMNSAAVE